MRITTKGGRKMKNKQNQYPFVDLTNDRAFKAFFSNNKVLLLSLLKAFLPLPNKKSIHSFSFIETKKKPHKGVDKKQSNQKVNIERSSLILTDPSLPSPYARDKQVVLDLNVRLNTGEKIDVEMQASNQEAFIERTIFYWARLFTKGLEKADDYKKLSPTYSIIFTKFPLREGKIKPHLIEKSIGNKVPADLAMSSFSIRSDDPPFHYRLSEHLRMFFVQLSRFRPPGGDVNKLLDLKSQWCYLLKESGRLTPKQADLLSRKGEDMALALKFLYELSADHRRQAEQEAIEKYERDQRGIKQFVYDKALKKGLKKGREEGREEGMQAGREEGKAEGMQAGIEKEKQAVALNMLKKEADIAFISEVTGLSVDEVKKLKNSSN